MFNKMPLSIESKVQLLKVRGLQVFPNEEEEIRIWLNNVHYYKLSGYWLAYELKNQSGSGRLHKFKNGTTWKKVKHTYIFDQKFRRLMWTAIEKIEVSVKAHWCQYLSMNYGPFPQDNKNLFSTYIYKSHGSYSKLITSYAKSNALYAKHYRIHYPELKTPPIWIAALIISFGEMVNWIKYINSAKIRNEILRPYGFDERIMISFLTHLIEVRNICAHNERLWNRQTNREFILPKRYMDIFVFNKSHKANRRIYNTIIMISEVLKSIDPKYPFLSLMKDLIKDNYLINPCYMGFPPNWESLSPWNTLSSK